MTVLRPPCPGLGLGVADPAGFLRKESPSQVGESAVAVATTKSWPNPRAVAGVFRKNKMKKNPSLSQPQQPSTKGTVSRSCSKSKQMNRKGLKADEDPRAEVKCPFIRGSTMGPGSACICQGAARINTARPSDGEHIPSHGPPTAPCSGTLTMLPFSPPVNPHFSNQAKPWQSWELPTQPPCILPAAQKSPRSLQL